jgi:hypothetical protein
MQLFWFFLTVKSQMSEIVVILTAVLAKKVNSKR